MLPQIEKKKNIEREDKHTYSQKRDQFVKIIKERECKRASMSDRNTHPKMCVRVCVCEGERERERERKTQNDRKKKGNDA